MTALKGTFLITFKRIGRNHNPPELRVTADGFDSLCAQIYKHVRPHLGSRFVDLDVDTEAMTGVILCGERTGGTFAIGEQFFNAELGPMPGYIAGRCGHRVAETEWRAGFRVCERCPNEATR